ncbi:MAG: hypothetical protein WCB62_23605, partial [Pseudolabrys sp.]
MHAVAPHLQASEQQNLELQNRLAREARARLDAAVERAVPNYREIDQDPRWHQWLRRYSRRSPHSLSPNQEQLVRWGFP